MAIDILREFLNPVIPYKVIDVNPIPDEVKFINVFGLQKILKIVNVVFEKGPGFFAWFLGLAELENVAETGCEQGIQLTYLEVLHLKQTTNHSSLPHHMQYQDSLSLALLQPFVI